MAALDIFHRTIVPYVCLYATLTFSIYRRFSDFYDGLRTFEGRPKGYLITFDFSGLLSLWFPMLSQTSHGGKYFDYSGKVVPK